MTKALTVLAECVDNRNGNRFRPGDVFEPAPTPDQAKRLVKAGCLPEAAIAVAVEADAEAEKAAEKKAADDLAAQAKAEADAKAEAKKAGEKKA